MELPQLRDRIRECSPFGADDTQRILDARFQTFPQRLEFALTRWPLGEAAVLDLGCSYGHCLAHFGAGSIGIDSVVEHVDFCNAIGLDARLADANQGLEVVPDETFDFAWVSDIIEHLDAPRLILREVRRKLKPGGKLILMTTALPTSPFVAAVVRRLAYRGFDADAHHYQFTAATLTFMIERAGYRVSQLVAPYHLPARLSPRIYVEAVPNPAAERTAAEAERRNRGTFTS